MFICGTPYGSTAGSDIQAKSNMKKAQDLLKASGYDGTPIVLMKPTDLAAIQKLPDVAAQLLRQAGFKVDLQAMDWQTLVGRRAKKDPPDKGGWNMFLTAWQAFDVWSPIANPTMDTRGEKSGWFGWAERRQAHASCATQFMRATDEPTKKKLADQIHARAFEIGDARAARRVRPADGGAQEHQRVLRHQRQHLLEPEEELAPERSRSGALSRTGLLDAMGTLPRPAAAGHVAGAADRRGARVR